MPVLIVGAATPFGHKLCEAFLDVGGQVRAYVAERDQATPLRSMGVHVAVGGWLDVERLEAASAQVHTVIHLTGQRADRKRADEEEAFEVTAIATHAAGVPRIVVGIDPGKRLAIAVQAAIDRFGEKTDATVIKVDLPADDDEAIDRIVAADTRSA